VIARHPLVSIVDDDESVREALPDLLREFGYAVETFSSAEAFLASDVVTQTGCLLLDISMPGMTGPELQQELNRGGHAPPIVFITANRDGMLWSRLLESGAVTCRLKPFSEEDLFDALTTALEA
jgi:FixJ family two-component response regulator